MLKIERVVGLVFGLVLGQEKVEKPKELKMDAKAKEILGQLVERYQKMNTYQHNATITIPAIKYKITMDERLAIEKPNKMKHEVKGTALANPFDTTIISDGKNLWNYEGMKQYTQWEAFLLWVFFTPKTKMIWMKQYTQREAPETLVKLGTPEAGPVPWFFQGPILTPQLMFFYEHPSMVLAGLYNQISFVGLQKVGKEELYVLKLSGEMSETTCWISKDELLIYKNVDIVKIPEVLEEKKKEEVPEAAVLKEVQVKVSLKNIKVNAEIPESEFKFVPPEGAKLVKEFEFAGEGRSSELMGKEAADFVLKDLEGNEISLKSLRGKVVILYFWDTRCRYCVKELPHIQKIYDDFRDKGLVVLGINSEPEVDKVKVFLKEKGLIFTVLHDAEDEVSKLYKVDAISRMVIIDREGKVVADKAIPRMVIIDREGKVVADFVGYRPEERLREELKKVRIE